ncbi:MAG: hypothetical protein B6229_01085, partial [Spirochaetaceae bacterium 4572_7]
MVLCSKCSKENRDIASFCKYCGSEIIHEDIHEEKENQLSLDQIVGLDEIKKILLSLINKIKLQEDRKSRGLPFIPITVHSVFKGNTGTGKTMLGKFLSKSFYEIGLITKDSIVNVTADDISNNMDSLDKYLKGMIIKASDGILFIDEIHENIDIISQISSLIENITHNTVIIVAGLKDSVDEYFKEHPDDMQRFNYIFNFPDLGVPELSKLSVNRLLKHGFILDKGVDIVLVEYVRHLLYSKDISLKNGWLVEKYILQKILTAQSNRLSTKSEYTDAEMCQITVKDIPIEFSIKTPEEILKSLDSLVGLIEVKKEIKNIAQTIAIQKRRKESGLSGLTVSTHIVFTGNPGTGKTTIARKLGELFKAIGLLPSGHVVETDRSNLVAQYTGQTAPNVNKYCDKAMGGILFIDEAYTLSGTEGGSDSFGQEAIDALLKRMEDDRGKFIVIVAGYKNEMDGFLSSNPGLKSRFTNFFHLSDYLPNELFDIFTLISKGKGYLISDDARIKLKKVFIDIYAKRGKNFANGREARNIFETAVKMQGARLSNLDLKGLTKESYMLLTADDIKYELDKSITSGEVLSQLDTLIGMESIKQEIRDLIDFLQVQKRREKATGDRSKIPMHFILTGNPGTGKTTIARLLGKLFKAIGLLPDDKVVEVDKSGLVGQYLGTTPKKVNEQMDKAMGGVFFIDEAYTLASENGHDMYGQEAIDTILKRMEDDRGKFIVMAAGYKDEMERFINSNPGLKSRFNRYIHFPDYTPKELAGIFKVIASKQGYR